jgi:hypothetical protein
MPSTPLTPMLAGRRRVIDDSDEPKALPNKLTLYLPVFCGLHYPDDSIS